MAINGISGLKISSMSGEHWDDVARIYAHGIAGGLATFEADVPTWEAFSRSKNAGLNLVALSARNEILGWTAAAATSTRPAYRGVIEHSVYVDRETLGAWHREHAAKGADQQGAGAGVLDDRSPPSLPPMTRAVPFTAKPDFGKLAGGSESRKEPEAKWLGSGWIPVFTSCGSEPAGKPSFWEASWNPVIQAPRG